MHDTTMTLVAPAAHQSGTAEHPSSKVRLARGQRTPSGGVRLARGQNTPSGGVHLARGLNTPSGGVRLARGLNTPLGSVRLARGLSAPSARTVSLEGNCTHVAHAPAPVRAFNTLTPQDARHDTGTPGNRVRALFHQLPGGGHPRRCVALCGKADVSSVTLCCLPPYG
jgi:hypothetical protein